MCDLSRGATWDFGPHENDSYWVVNTAGREGQ